VGVSCSVRRIQREAKDRSATRSVQGQTLIKRYFYHPSFPCVSLDRFERNSVSTLSIFCLELGSISQRRSTYPQGDFPTIVCVRMWEEERGRQRGEVESERVRAWGVESEIMVGLCLVYVNI
jgi:hypothetical protein